ncbi:MAG: hypothetical protein IJ153_09850 [Clostridia bacterium]|nr:hypothetical protein [Clostridia bacterium]
MADIGSSIKGIWLKGMEAIGNTASNIATNTKSKVDEMNLVNRRAEILKDFGNQAYALWLKGEHFPEELANQLQELQKLDDQLNDLRAERLAGVKVESAEKQPEIKAEEEAPVEDLEVEEVSTVETIDIQDQDTDGAADEAIAEPPVIRVENPEEEAEPAVEFSDAINDLFEKIPTVEEETEKVNSTLDSLENHLKEFSADLDQKLDELTEKIDSDLPQ